MSRHLHVVQDQAATTSIRTTAMRSRAILTGDLGNLVAEYARLRNSPHGDYRRRHCLLVAWRWRRIWRGVPMPKAKTHTFPLYDGDDAA